MFYHRFTALKAAQAKLWRPIDGAWLAAYRVLFGLELALALWRFSALGWIDEFLVGPSFHFKYWGFSWVEPLPHADMQLLFSVLIGLGLMVAAGLAFRLAAFGLALGFSYLQLIDVSTYLNHYYLASLLAWLLALSPANRLWSVDAWLKRKWAERQSGVPHVGASAQVAGAWQLLFRFQVGVVYVFAGLAKAQPDWLLHGQPLRIWLGANTDLPLIGPLFALSGAAVLLSWCGFLFDISIVAWLSWSKTRPYAYAVVLCFHALTRLLFDIGMFPLIMAISALMFFSASWPRVFWGKLRSRFRADTVLQATSERAAAEAASFQVLPRWRQRLGQSALIAYIAVQVALPLRHLLYSGNVLWHEQGMRFSWRVMLRAKGGATTFVVRQEHSGREWHVSPREYLTPFQENEMSGQPDLILQLAHHIKSDFERRGLGPVSVRAEAQVTLNGRRAAPLIDPEIDLASVADSPLIATWILPAPSQAPPHTRVVR